MSAASEFTTAVQALTAALLASAEDPADQVRLLSAMATFSPTGDGATGDLFRRASLTTLARASAAYQPSSYDDAAALRGAVCDLLAAEETRAADQGEDVVFAAFRALRIAVAQDLTARAGSLAHLRAVQTHAPQPALALAYRMYGTAIRAGELVDYAAADNPLFLPTQFRARER